VGGKSFILCGGNVLKGKESLHSSEKVCEVAQDI